MITGACRPGGGSVAGKASFSLGKRDTPVCPVLLDLQGCQEGERSLRALGCPPSSPVLQGLHCGGAVQMCTNKGGLKQNESKQTNGIRLMGVGGLVHSDKHNDALCVCVCV